MLEWFRHRDFRIALALLVGMIILFLNFTFTPTGSMEPTIEKWKLYPCRRFVAAEDIKHNDIVVFWSDGTQYLKRVIGLPGDEVMISNGIVYLNGCALEGAYTPHDGVWHVGEDEMFVLGDNRSNSYDSRYTDTLPKLSSVFGAVTK